MNVNTNIRPNYIISQLAPMQREGNSGGGTKPNPIDLNTPAAGPAVSEGQTKEIAELEKDIQDFSKAIKGIANRLSQLIQSKNPQVHGTSIAPTLENNQFKTITNTEKDSERFLENLNEENRKELDERLKGSIEALCEILGTCKLRNIEFNDNEVISDIQGLYDLSFNISQRHHFLNLVKGEINQLKLYF